MWAVIIWVMLLLAAPQVVAADSVFLSWLPVSGAIQYKVYQSLDQGATWQAISTPTGTNTNAEVSGDKLILFKVCSVVTGAESCEDAKGAWYNGALRRQPAQLSVR